MIDAACAAYEKSKERKETVEGVDMGNQFMKFFFENFVEISVIVKTKSVNIHSVDKSIQ